MLLIVSGNVELNPGPTKKCPKCNDFVANCVKKCNCGHVFQKSKQPDVHVENERVKVSMRMKRGSQNECEIFERKMMNKLYMNRKRKMQTNEEALCRREANRLAMKQKRLCETDNEALCRREANKLAMKQKRLCETDNEALCRREANKLAMK